MLRPFEKATEFVSSEKHAASSIMLPILLNEQRESDSAVIRDVKTEIINDLKNRYQDDNVKLFMYISAFLDPRFNEKLLSCEQIECVKKELRSQIDKLDPMSIKTKVSHVTRLLHQKTNQLLPVT